MNDLDLEYCKTCGSLLEPVYENVGFDEPGVDLVEIVEYKCECGSGEK